MSATWEYEDSDIYVAERPRQVPASEQFVTVVIWTVVAAFCVGFGIALIRGLAHIPSYIHRMGW